MAMTARQFASMLVSSIPDAKNCNCCCCQRQRLSGKICQPSACQESPNNAGQSTKITDLFSARPICQTTSQLSEASRESSTPGYKQWSFFAPFCLVGEPEYPEEQDGIETERRLNDIYKDRYGPSQSCYHQSIDHTKEARDLHSYTPTGAEAGNTKKYYLEEIVPSKNEDRLGLQNRIVPTLEESFSASEYQRYYSQEDQSSYDSAVVVTLKAPKSSEVDPSPKRDAPVSKSPKKMNSPEYPVQMVLGEILMNRRSQQSKHQERDVAFSSKSFAKDGSPEMMMTLANYPGTSPQGRSLAQRPSTPRPLKPQAELDENKTLKPSPRTWRPPSSPITPPPHRPPQPQHHPHPQQAHQTHLQSPAAHPASYTPDMYKTPAADPCTNTNNNTNNDKDNNNDPEHPDRPLPRPPMSPLVTKPKPQTHRPVEQTQRQPEDRSGAESGRDRQGQRQAKSEARGCVVGAVGREGGQEDREGAGEGRKDGAAFRLRSPQTLQRVLRYLGACRE